MRQRIETRDFLGQETIKPLSIALPTEQNDSYGHPCRCAVGFAPLPPWAKSQASAQCAGLTGE